MNKLITFDIDGTLVENSTQHDLAFRYAFEKVFNREMEHDWDDVIKPGMIDSEIIYALVESNKLSVTDEQYEEIKDRMTIYYLAHSHLETVQALPGVENLLKGLLKEGIATGLLTGNLETIAFEKLKVVGLNNYFISGGFGNEALLRQKLLPIAKTKIGDLMEKEFDQVFHIGDSISDIRTAKENGAIAVAVLTGHTPLEKIKNEKPDIIFKDLSDTKNIIKTLIEFK